MSFDHSKNEIFKLLKANLSDHASTLSIKKDTKDNYYLNTMKIGNNKKPHFFGTVQINKSYVSYHLMPIYINPLLLDSISDDLKKRMQGKSCFNFRMVDKKLFLELKALTNASYAFYEKEGYI